ncbi:hypothetical protein M409DRAFT_71605 [Zasmidium cellare ATCC 36951]|uniref:Uncharacterized protein n=1 Tax=Zasmidium cellare ATCC 36951 TaxID=1080233 RepID=A0A6A6BVF8_ZASCE|nr:uncharacterized protein M409DRAFT_71605 [Zasmidium cellare ATCC 36951]KAF2158513.1 hypothetical protein M409DRAFT_71605 [Zasmidium cellare ATCC 36951]
MGSIAESHDEHFSHLPPLAVVGMSFRFPSEATDAHEFWKMMLEKRCASKEIPADRFSSTAHHHPDVNRVDSLSIQGGHFIDGDVSAFDAPFFSIGAAEAEAMDPVQRLTLETAYRAIENAGIPLERITGTKTCVFTGSFSIDYATMLHKDPHIPAKYHATGTATNMQANRVSWFFNSTGPSANIDTAWSSSLIALDMVCQSIWAGDSNMGLACGSNIILTPESGLALDNLGMLGKDSRCYSFDHRANGYARGEGFGVLAVKPLADAIVAGDTIRAVIRSSGSNQDGRTPTLTQPSKLAQESLIMDTYAKAGLAMSETRYFEAHGTGTPVGDAIEASAIGASFRQFRSPEAPLYIGSVKSNIRHLEGASGVAGVIKTILALEAGIIPSNSNFERLNPKIDADFLNIKVAEDATPWPTKGLRRASVASFGFGGANSHIILDDAYNFLRLNGLTGIHNTAVKPPNHGLSLDMAFNAGQATTHPKVLVWSTADEAGIGRTKSLWQTHFETLAIPRHDLPKYIDNALIDRMTGPLKANSNPVLGFVFTGQGSQGYAMGRELMSSFPVYQNSLIRSSEILKDFGASWDLLGELLKSEKGTNVNKALYSQPARTALQIAQVDLMHSLEVEATTLVGHSSGEIAAAYCMGALNHRSALKVAFYRGVLASKLSGASKTKGAMMAVGLSQSEAVPYLNEVAAEMGSGRLVVACVNSPKNVTISGESSHVDHLKGLLDGAQVFARLLKVDVAYHSFQMLEAADEYLSTLSDLQSQPVRARGKTPQMVSSVTGTWVSIEKLSTAAYWVANMVSPVLFSKAVSTLTSRSPISAFKKIDGSHRKLVAVTDLLEIGPHSALQGPIGEILHSIDRNKAISYTSMLVRKISALDSLADAVGRLHCLGPAVSLDRFNNVTSGKASTQKTLSFLPEYSFNKSKTYWHESRISRDYRFRNTARHDLVGVPDSDWNPLEAKWRNIIRVADIPWVEEHKINGVILYPAAGMLAMAIEATRQLADPTKQLSGFTIKNATFHSALTIPATSAGWHDNCNGSIQLVYAAEATELDQGQERQKWSDGRRRDFKIAREACGSQVNIDELYDAMNDSTVTKVRTFKWSDYYSTPETGMHHVIHPTTFDCILQGILASYTAGGTKRMSTAIPTHFERIWVAAQGLGCADAEHVNVFGNTHRVGRRETTSTVVAFDEKCLEVLVEVEGFKTTDIDDIGAADDEQATTSTNLCHNIDWKPDLDLTSSLQVQVMCDDSVPVEDPESEFFDKLDFLLIAYIKRTMNSLTPETIATLSVKKRAAAYLDWMKHKLELVHANASKVLPSQFLARLDDAAYVKEIESELASKNKQGIFYTQLGTIHEKLITGEEDALALLFQGDLVKDFYYEVWNTVPCVARFNHYLDAIVHKNPACKILEVGAGTGATTTQLMKTLTTHGNGEKCVPRYGTFDYTDVSPFFFSAAQETYHDHGSKMRFKTLNIESDPEPQGFECGSYDILVAAAVLHATEDLDKTLANCKKLLKPGGKLILWEITTPNGLRTNFAFGLLEGWWLSSEPFRSRSPCIDEDAWDASLRKAGFSGCDVVLKDYQDVRSHEFSVICTTAIGAVPQSSPSNETSQTLVLHTDDQAELVAQTKTSLSRSAHNTIRTVNVSNLPQLAPTDGTVIISLLEVGKAVWENVDRQLFDTLRTLMTSTSISNVLWITKENTSGTATPSLRLIDGIARVLNSETDSNRVISLDLEEHDQQLGLLSDHQMGHVDRLLKAVSQGTLVDTEFREHHGVMNVGRLIESTGLNEQIYRRELPSQVVTRPWKDALPLRLAIGTPGLLNTLHFIEDTEFDQTLAPEEVEIDVRSVGLNFRDVLIALGRLNQDRVGCEVAGIITRVGSETQDLRPGDRVAGCCFDSYKTFARINWRGAAKIPDDMSFAVAASLPVNYCTAWRGLHDIARLRPGESVLIHSAAGGTGQAAVQVARHLGATIFATVGTESKKQQLITRYGIPHDHIFSSRDIEFARGIKRLTNGQGVAAVFNSLFGEGLAASWDCIAPFGRFIEIGKKDILARGKLEILAPVEPLQVYGVSEIEKAFRVMQAGKTSGKIVVNMDPNEQVEASVQTRPSFYFDSNATYVISGGLGGIGRSVATWFADRGARHLVLLSRSGGRTIEEKQLIDQLTSKGVQIKTPACDVGDAEALRAALHDCQQNAAFESMPFESWEAATRSKVGGSWNLHSFLPSGMDFFVMFSSVAGVCGSKGQANYAAGNAYQDALAHYRVKNGEKATSLDLGPFFSVGIMTENNDLQSRWKGLVDAPVTEENLFALLDYYCDPSNSKTRDDLLCQTTVGLALGIRVDSGSAYYLRKPMFQNLALARENSVAEGVLGGAKQDAVDFAAVFRNAATAADASSAVKDALTRKLASTLSLSMEDLEAGEHMHSYGVDSLAAVEIRNWFAKEVHADIAIFDILGGSTIATVSSLAANKSKYRPEGWAGWVGE